MDATVRLEHQLLAVESEHALHAMLDIAVPDADGADGPPPLDLALVVDRSGSMAGAKLDVTRRCAAWLVQRLRPTDRLALVAYDDEVRLLAAMAQVHHSSVLAAIDSIGPGGSTNLSGGWLKGVEELQRGGGTGAVRAVVLMTDGLANVGVTDNDSLTGMTAGAHRQGVRTSTVGFGDDFDEELLTAMADAGGGNAHWAATPDDAPAIFAAEFEGLAAVVAHNLSVEIRPSDEVTMLGVLNDWPAVATTGGVQVHLGDAYAGQRLRLVFQLAVPGLADLGPVRVADVVLRWATVGDHAQLHERTIPVVANVVPAVQAASEPPDAEVIEEVVVLRAATAEREARRLGDEGDFDAARTVLGAAADELRGLAPTSPRAAELLERADELGHTQASMRVDAFDAQTRKSMLYRSRSASRRPPKSH